MLVLGVETSCDETAVGIVEDAADVFSRIHANCVATQYEEHKPYGGVVPEIAARAHLDRLDDLVHEALRQAGIGLADVDGIAATCGPGLIGGVMVGAMTGKAMAAVAKKPFIAVNHLEAHALTARLSHDVQFPYLLLLMSGGHCQILLVKGVGDFQQLGTTIDDAVGECFDKSAKLLGLGYPGGPLLEQAAVHGSADAIKLPRPLCGRPNCDFSFSGLKTSVRTAIQKQDGLTDAFVADMSASLQKTIGEILVDRLHQAFKMLDTPVTALVVGGGVAANKVLRARLTECAESYKVPFMAPPINLCTDNGVMIAWAGLERLRLNMQDELSFRARPRWPLEELNEG